MRTYTTLLLVLGFALGSSTLRAQDDPSRPGYYRQWLRTQVQQWDQVVRVDLRETTNRKLDGPSGSQSVTLSADVTIYPREGDLDRRVVAAELNGRRVPDDRLEELTNRWSNFTRDLGQESTVFADLRQRMLQRTRPTGRPTLERRDGKDLYRVDLLSTVPRLRIDRMTLWFDAADGRLVRSRTIFRPRAQRTSLIVENEYRRIAQLDVPVRRSIEATVQQKRRLRHFTTIISVQSLFEDLKIERVR
ncbi:MAG: hypothetical protein HKN37_00205 [Rhodothermales bacterium]|nr:hypothetical protein [Rhodothermales bacterium]